MLKHFIRSSGIVKYFFGISVVFLFSNPLYAQKIRDHKVVLDEKGRLLSWTSFDNIIQWSMNFINHCPTFQTIFGDDPLYLVTSKLDVDGTFMEKQNNQGSNVYWAVETLKKYYAYTGDRQAFTPVRLLSERVMKYNTPLEWAWPGVPRTQDDSPDGEYTDEWAGADKLCMVALGYMDFFKLTGENKYFKEAVNISRVVLKNIKKGDENHSPLPFRVNLKTGEILDPYCSNMILVIKLIDELTKLDAPLDQTDLQQKKDLLLKWIFDYPMQNNRWSGYYEDVVPNYENLNQQNPLETARYFLQHPELDPDYTTHVPALIKWVEERFGKTKHYGATSIREQDGCFMEMSSHTARYASVVAMWYGVSMDPKDREEARAAFALSTYSAYNKYSKNGLAINYVGIGYNEPWFSDSYWDYLSHFFDGMVELPEMLPAKKNRLFYSTSVITDIHYAKDQIEYQAFDADGTEKMKLNFEPVVYADGQLLEKTQWSFGDYRGVSGILEIQRNGVKHIEIRKE